MSEAGTNTKRMSTSQVKKQMTDIFAEWCHRKEKHFAEELIIEKKNYSRAEHLIIESVPPWLMWYSDALTLSDGNYWALIHPPEFGTLAISISMEEVIKTYEGGTPGYKPAVQWYYYDKKFDKAMDLMDAIGRLYYFSSAPITDHEVKQWKDGPF